MTDKETEFGCKMHSGLRAETDDLKQSDRDQWDAINGMQTSKASSSQMKWVIGIFLILSISIVGFLWRTQVLGTDTVIKKIEIMEEKNVKQREETGIKMDSLKDKLNELCWTMDQMKKK